MSIPAATIADTWTHEPTDQLTDEPTDEPTDEHSGVRSRADLTEPRPVYAAFTVHGRERRYYLGTRFVDGIIVAFDWREPLERDGVPADHIEATASWLRARAL